MEGKDKEDNDQRQQTNRTTTLTTENEPTTTPTSENKPPKYKTDAEPECDKVKTDTEQEAHSDLDQDETVIEIGEAAEEADTSMESTLESTMETDSQIESQNEEKSTTETGRKTRKCKQWTPGSYAALHKGHQKEKKEKKQTKQDEQKSQKRVILHLENERQKNKKKITELEAEIDILAAQIEENDHSTGLNDQQSREIAELKTKIHLIQERENEHLSEINSLQQKVDQLEKDNETWKWESVRPQNKRKSLNKLHRQLSTKKRSWSRLPTKKPKKSPGSKTNWKGWKTDRKIKANLQKRNHLSS